MALSKIPLAVARGDGIGPEIMTAVLNVLRAVRAPFETTFVDMGKEVYQRGISSGVTPDAKATIERTRLLLKGPMETPKGKGVKSINVTARKVWSAYANKRVFKTLPGVETVFSKAGIPVDLTLFRENQEDTYGGIEHFQTHDVAQCRRLITRPGSVQLHRKAFESARNKLAKRVTCVHKANIMKLTDGLFLETFYEVAKDFPDLRVDDIIVDDVAMKLVSRPDSFDVLVLPNLQGDIISDLCAGLVGGLGMAPSANLGDEVCIFEAVHGTAPDIAGLNVANPTALLLSATMMLRHLHLGDQAHHIEVALQNALAAGIRTKDLAQAPGHSPVSTSAFADGIIKHLPAEALHAPVNIPFEALRRRTDVEKHTMLVTPRTQPEQTTGVDVFVDSHLRPPELAEALLAVAPANVKLTMISNRGTQVWPTGSLLTQCVNHYRCRLELVDSPAAAGAETLAPGAATPAEAILLEGVASIAKTVHVCSLEMLKTINGAKAYTLAQGE